MGVVTLIEARNRLEELLDRVDAGEEVSILREGKAPVRLVARHDAEPRSFDWQALRAFTDSLPKSGTSSVDVVRQLRDDARY
ncbi:Prevent-host-death family protein [uncultured Pleomorphomonas sp.]|uniref:Prevent-host-death family protein n=1 Tax=uncultured Pleomorphomonas sp. TaxID=442121 RepID=A0A212LM41_9HYPH|nr:type II toxin-antitoxin system Phd/YefM family antitoxin [uncultured Pleomorphomonas sp.]SCM78593.1 Prevent-host-death family protein [uncultured Pleomorphomonas sp.]